MVWYTLEYEVLCGYLSILGLLERIADKRTIRNPAWAPHE